MQARPPQTCKMHAERADGVVLHLQKILTIHITGSAAIPGVTPSPFSAGDNNAIYRGLVNGQPGSEVLLSISVPGSATAG